MSNRVALSFDHLSDDSHCFQTGVTLRVFLEQHFHAFASEITELQGMINTLYLCYYGSIMYTYHIDVRVHERDECLNDVRSVVEEGQIQQQLRQAANSNSRQ